MDYLRTRRLLKFVLAHRNYSHKVAEMLEDSIQTDNTDALLMALERLSQASELTPEFIAWERLETKIVEAAMYIANDRLKELQPLIDTYKYVAEHHDYNPDKFGIKLF